MHTVGILHILGKYLRFGLAISLVVGLLREFNIYLLTLNLIIQKNIEMECIQSIIIFLTFFIQIQIYVFVLELERNWL